MTGCAVGPDYQGAPAMAMPSQWASQKADEPVAPAVLSSWWRRFEDPLLNQLVQEAVQANLDVASAKASLRQARASYKVTSGASWPSLEASASVGRSGDASNAANLFQSGFDAGWEIDLFGANRRATEAARYEVEATESDLRSTLLSMIGDVATYYLEARGYQARTAYARKSAESLRQTAALTRAKFASGSASAADVASIEGQAASIEAEIEALQANYAQSVHRLGVLLGQVPNALYSRLDAPTPLPAAPRTVALGIPADVLLARPDVRAAERRLAQYTAKVGQAEAARYPSISLSGSMFVSGRNPSEMAKRSAISWSWGPSISIPIFEGGRLVAAVERARAQQDEFAIAFHAAVLSAFEEVENAAVALSRERTRNARLAASAQAYEQAATLALALYQTGSTSQFEVLDAYRSLYSSQSSLIQSDVQIAIDYISLNKALGGGWDGAITVDSPSLASRLPKPQSPDSTGVGNVP